MTDAYVSRNVNNATDAIITNHDGGHTNSNNTNEENCSQDGLATNLKCNCNETDDRQVEAPIQPIMTTTYHDNVTNSTVDPQTNHLSVIEEKDRNVLLKYVHKKNEENALGTKTTGHPKNTLRRRKRSENLDDILGTKAPLIVNYETSHGPQNNVHGSQRDVEVWLPAKSTGNVIKNSALADFNIETLHDNEPLKKNIHGPSIETIPENANDSNENIDRANYERNNRKPQTTSEESNEQSNERSIESTENSGESEQYSRNKEKYPDSHENYRDDNRKHQNDRQSSTEIENANAENSKEDGESKEYSKLKHTKPSYKESESIENSSEEKEKSNASYSSKEEPNSGEESNSKYKNQERYQYKPEISSPAKIQDVDLGDYERIQVNEYGQIEPAKDTHENTTFDPAKDVILTTKPGNRIKQSEKITSLSKDNADSTSVDSHNHDEPTHINDGEVKPVVEINAEVDSTETSDENSNEALKQKLENESLETLTGVNDKDSDEKSDKLQEDSNKTHQGDVKQQFERIPLNYNHADGKQNKDTNADKVEDTKQTNDNDNDDGTIDKVQPRYDENLNIKFDDINIKLPEIKLPDDILSYAYEDPPLYKDEEQNTPTNYHSNYNKNENVQQENPTYYQGSSNYKKSKKTQRKKPAYPSSYNRNDDEQQERPAYYQDSSIYNKNKAGQIEKPAYYQKDEQVQKPRFYHYSDEMEDEPRARIKQEDDDNEDYNDDGNHYYGYHGDGKKKENYQQKQNNKEEEEDDDLYEKFVRERFGKQGSFQKRLEKLTDYKVQNPHLYQKVQKLLKKTKDVKTEAEKSGDPNAGYMWTLEYEEKL